MTWDFTISAKNRYLKGKNIKILLLSLLLILLFMLIFIYKKNDMYEIDAATKYKFESLMGKSEYEITLVLGKEDKYEGSGYPHPVYILDNGIEVKLIFVHAYDLEYGSKLWRIVYKKDGKIIRDVRTKLNNFKSTYTAAGKLDSVTDSTGAKILYEYNGNGLLTGITDANGHKSSFEYSILGNPLHMLDGSGAGVSYSYNEAGQLTGIINDGAQKGISYEYDSLGRCIKETDARGYSISYEYDPAGNLIKTTDAFKRAEIIKRDPMGRMTGIENKGIQNDTFKFSYEYNAAGDITGITKPDKSVEQRSYDSMERLVKVDMDGIQSGIYTYDSTGNLKNKTENLSGVKIESEYKYDKNNRFIEEYIPRTSPRRSRYSYDGFGNIVNEYKEGSGKSAPVNTCYEYKSLK